MGFERSRNCYQEVIDARRGVTTAIMGTNANPLSGNPNGLPSQRLGLT